MQYDFNEFETSPGRSRYTNDLSNFYITPWQLDHLTKPRYSFDFDENDRVDRLQISDIVFGQETIGDAPYDNMILELVSHPAFLRLFGIQQLTNPEEFSIHPGVARFSRFEHLMNGLVAERKMVRQKRLEGIEISDRDLAVNELRILFSDLFQWAMSHLGDQLIEGVGKTEDAHDKTIPDFLERLGIVGIINHYGFSVEETVFPPINDHVESPSPLLIIDRIYNVHQYFKMFRDPAYWQIRAEKMYYLPDDLSFIGVKDPKDAMMMSMISMILGSEHFAHPIQRFEMANLGLMVKRHFMQGLDDHNWDYLLSNTSGSVEDDLLSSDVLLQTILSQRDDLFSPLSEIMRTVARYQRRVGAHGRLTDIEFVLRSNTRQGMIYDFPDPLNSLHESNATELKSYCPLIGVEVGGDGPEAIHINHAAKTLEFCLPAFKRRKIDPHVTVDGQDMPVSKWSEATHAKDRQLHRWFEQYERTASRNYVVSVPLFDRDTRHQIFDSIKATEEWWQARKERGGDKLNEQDLSFKMVAQARLGLDQAVAQRIIDHNDAYRLLSVGGRRSY